MNTYDTLLLDDQKAVAEQRVDDVFINSIGCYIPWYINCYVSIFLSLVATYIRLSFLGSKILKKINGW